MRNALRMFGVIGFVLVATIALAGPPDMVKIDQAANKKPGVEFNHKAHMERVESCDTCHHMDKGLTADSDLSKVQACSACHLKPEAADTPDMTQMSMKKNPFHMLCIDCHKTGGKGPTKCNDCHKK